ncbi:putative mitochondrial protein [Andalucia godoyi]|uniref:Putative mitochondrial protein n=1 Tax=Andalucia godoyi TaxID=505711 RepID=A0A8K0AG35_ANDGO|nr:putative mitochondrial protein [Andalucia godoyi]|eukprot:ANDGO_00809.mRNA.1 putative mitochondrial protein
MSSFSPPSRRPPPSPSSTSASGSSYYSSATSSPAHSSSHRNGPPLSSSQYSTPTASQRPFGGSDAYFNVASSDPDLLVSDLTRRLSNLNGGSSFYNSTGPSQPASAPYPLLSSSSSSSLPAFSSSASIPVHPSSALYRSPLLDRYYLKTHIYDRTEHSSSEQPRTPRTPTSAPSLLQSYQLSSASSGSNGNYSYRNGNGNGNTAGNADGLNDVYDSPLLPERIPEPPRRPPPTPSSPTRDPNGLTRVSKPSELSSSSPKAIDSLYQTKLGQLYSSQKAASRDRSDEKSRSVSFRDEATVPVSVAVEAVAAIEPAETPAHVSDCLRRVLSVEVVARLVSVLVGKAEDSGSAWNAFLGIVESVNDMTPYAKKALLEEDIRNLSFRMGMPHGWKRLVRGDKHVFSNTKEDVEIAFPPVYPVLLRLFRVLWSRRRGLDPNPEPIHRDGEPFVWIGVRVATEPLLAASAEQAQRAFPAVVPSVASTTPADNATPQQPLVDTPAAKTKDVSQTAIVEKALEKLSSKSNSLSPAVSKPMFTPPPKREAEKSEMAVQTEEGGRPAVKAAIDKVLGLGRIAKSGDAPSSSSSSAGAATAADSSAGQSGGDIRTQSGSLHDSASLGSVSKPTASSKSLEPQQPLEDNSTFVRPPFSSADPFDVVPLPKRKPNPLIASSLSSFVGTTRPLYLELPAIV